MTSSHVRLMPVAAMLALLACGSQADRIGVGAECTSDEECPDMGDLVISCLTGFKGGYCGIRDCAAHTDCPEDSFCVEHVDGVRYCFRSCQEKSECNVNRSPENESNCSSNVTPVQPHEGKACVPPSG